jgi:6-phosphogluconolactonase/glucosamine-6-phosphate isomerase/deaminase
MPFPENPTLFQRLFESDSWVVGYEAGNKNEYPQRVTTTITFLKNIVDTSIVYATGENKKQAIKKIMGGALIAETPGRVINTMKDVMFFTDQDL